MFPFSICILRSSAVVSSTRVAARLSNPSLFCISFELSEQLITSLAPFTLEVSGINQELTMDNVSVFRSTQLVISAELDFPSFSSQHSPLTTSWEQFKSQNSLAQFGLQYSNQGLPATTLLWKIIRISKARRPLCSFFFTICMYIIFDIYLYKITLNKLRIFHRILLSTLL